MMLIKFECIANNAVVRTVIFQRGLNIIINNKNISSSGNSVGKSTLGRLIDYIFMGSVQQIFVDPETGQPNKTIESYIEENNVWVMLEVKCLDGKHHTFSRNISIRNKNVFRIDSITVKDSVYSTSLGLYVFGIEFPRPTIRFVMPKFVRNNLHRMNNTTHFLEKFASNKDYSELFLFSFGFEGINLLADKRGLDNKAKKADLKQKFAKKIRDEIKPDDQLSQLEKELYNMKSAFLNFEPESIAAEAIDKIVEIQAEENSIKQQLIAVNTKILNLNKTIERINTEGSGHLYSNLLEIYEYASCKVDGPLADLANAVKFHNSLVDRKLSFIKSKLPDFVAEKESLERKLGSFAFYIEREFVKLKSSEPLDKITSKLERIGELNEDIGRFRAINEQYENATEEQALINTEIKTINNTMQSNLLSLKKFMRSFNRYFKIITRYILQEDGSISYTIEENTGIMSLRITGLTANTEGGRKTMEVICFDFAYIFTISRMKLKRANFVFHDFVDGISQQNFVNIFNISNRLPGQQIISLLSDKFSDDYYTSLKENIILELSQDDKFFKI